MQRIELARVVVDAGTQIRAAINEETVAEYAEQMTAGVVFPPVVLFHDGNAYYLADGFHRTMAARRIGATDIPAEVQAGTKEDALWFALGANRKNGQRLNANDKRHAILLALQTWPEKSVKQIAEQIGVNQGYAGKVKSELQDNGSVNLPSRVTGKDGKSYPASRQRSTEPTPPVPPPTADGRLDKSREAVRQRRERMRVLAAEGYTSLQIASDLGIGIEGCRATLRSEGIDVPADKVTHHSRRHDANRIVSQTVMDAEHLTADVNLVDFSELDPTQIGGWLESLNASRRALGAFIRRLEEEHKKHGEAA